MKINNKWYTKWAYKNPKEVEDAEYTVLDDENPSEARQEIKREIPITKSPAGKVSGMVMTVFGWIGVGLSALVFLPVASIVSGMFDILSPLMFPLVTGVVGAGLVLGGTHKRRRVRRFYDYVKGIGDEAYCTVKSLSDRVGRSEKFVTKDLKKMIDLRMFPEGRLDRKRSYLFLTHDVYTEYLQLQEGIKLSESERQKKAREEEERLRREEDNPELRDVHSVIRKGEETLRTIREANSAIHSVVISEKLDRLEIILKKIFDYIEENPKELPEIRKFLNYYLPTTLKLVNSYREMDAEVIQGPNIRKTKREIEGTLDTINNAFENLLDSFYEDTAIDISSDISVLETMLAQEGLTEGKFSRKGEKK